MRQSPAPPYWSTRALLRVSEILDFLSDADVENAEKWLEGLFGKIEKVSILPGMGRPLPGIKRDDIREVLYDDYKVVYKVKPDRIEVLTVRHMRQKPDDSDLGKEK